MRKLWVYCAINQSDSAGPGLVCRAVHPGKAQPPGTGSNTRFIAPMDKMRILKLLGKMYVDIHRFYQFFSQGTGQRKRLITRKENPFLKLIMTLHHAQGYYLAVCGFEFFRAESAPSSGQCQMPPPPLLVNPTPEPNGGTLVQVSPLNRTRSATPSGKGQVGSRSQPSVDPQLQESDPSQVQISPYPQPPTPCPLVRTGHSRPAGRSHVCV